MRSKTIFSKVKVQRTGKTPDQIEKENERAEAIEKLKGKKDAPAKLRKMYDHLPADQVEYIVAVFKKYQKKDKKKRILKNIY